MISIQEPGSKFAAIWAWVRLLFLYTLGFFYLHFSHLARCRIFPKNSADQVHGVLGGLSFCLDLTDKSFS
ncbi:hypothetical protein SAMN05660860_01224 [Geoalkalibacter ferrihydriticus]|uniref:Uncharacterized protein n=2 Tax=Geoalkalibacter ferrihydriticus TaxID=392333 RepID=A0A0C2EGI2_9BACT|nr:hypothetical protein GFER_03540 [Geoalkalibacter ferrihydriticus DSM 17813]SDL76481.1 hypothetical protein SAMN05660860_01224 [Geoalkalibacter ferrihydriticus]